MKWNFYLTAFILALCLFGCANNNNDTMQFEPSGFGIEPDSPIKSGKTRMIPVKANETVNDYMYDLNYASVRVFPYTLYSDAKLNTEWASDASNDTPLKLYYDYSTTTAQELYSLFGKDKEYEAEKTSAKTERTADRAAKKNFYIASDMSNGNDTDRERYFKPFAYNETDGTHTLTFTYSNNFGRWGNGNGNLQFKITDSPDWSGSVYGNIIIFETDVSYRAEKEAGEEILNGLATGLVDGNEYTFVIDKWNDKDITLSLNGELGEPTMERAWHIRGDLTGWNFKKLSIEENGNYSYTFTYYNWMGNNYYGDRRPTLFAIMPINSYALGTLGGPSTNKNDHDYEDSTAVIDGKSLPVTKETVYSKCTAHNIMLEHFSDGTEYVLSFKPLRSAKISETVWEYTVSEANAQ